MFNVRIVGTANAIAAGWGNMGGGATALIMPLLYEVGEQQNARKAGASHLARPRRSLSLHINGRQSLLSFQQPCLMCCVADCSPVQGFRHQVPGFSAWRWAFFIPGAIYIICGIFALLFGQVRDGRHYSILLNPGRPPASLSCTVEV
jgi:nitrate/nitrite transporter NarK